MRLACIGRRRVGGRLRRAAIAGIAATSLRDPVEHAVRDFGVRLVQRVRKPSASAPPWLFTTTPFRPTSVAPL